MGTTKRVRRPASLQQWMEWNGVTGARLAQLAGMPQSMISMILKGSRRCSLDKALALHEITGVPVEKLVAWPRVPISRKISRVSNSETPIS